MINKERADKFEIVAEIANCHSGSLEYILQLISNLSESNFKFVKLQIYTAEELLTPDHPRFQHFREQAFTFPQWKRIVDWTRQCSLIPIADIYGLDSLEIARNLGIGRIKIPSTNSELDNLMGGALEQGEFERVYLSTTGKTFYEIEKLLYSLPKLLKMNQSCVLVHGHQEFPTPPEHTNLEFISRLSTRFSHIADIGFADHTSPTEYHISRACEIAIGAGAKYIEKHVCIERSETKIDYHSSLEASEFTKYLENISSAISVFLSNKETESRSINEYLQNMKKFPVPRSNIFEGQEIRKSEIVDLRVSSDLPCVAKIKGGEIAKSDLERFKGISFNQLKFGITAVVLCRSDSKRMENKALNAISGQIPIIHLLKRITHSKLVDNIVLATTNRTIDDKLCEVAETNNFQVYRGSELDVLQRMVEAASEFKSNHVVRITGDDICLSYDDLDDALVAHLSANAHYTNMLTIPSGTEAEIFDFEFLCDFNSSRDEQWDTEYLSNYVNVFDDVEIRRIGFTSKFDRNRDWRLTLDNHEDFSLLEEVFSRLIRIGKIDNYTLDDIVKIIEEEPKLLEKARNRNKRHHKKDSYGELFRWQLN